VALGSGPGHIEVCHWIFENDMTWTTADWSNNLHPQSDQCVFYSMSYVNCQVSNVFSFF
jgi:hypothetical protein